MNKTKAMFLLIFLPFLLTACNVNPFAKKLEKDVQQVEKQDNRFTGSLKDLLETGQQQVCTYTTTDTENVTISMGKVYISGTDMRGDFETNVEGQSLLSHMIKMEDTAYVWQEGQTQGIKMSFEDVDASAQTNENTVETPEKPTENIDLLSNYEYDCDNWIPDKKMFELPAEVTFVDLSETMQSIQNNAVEAMDNAQPSGDVDPNAQVDCSACDNAPEEARALCLAALKCN